MPNASNKISTKIDIFFFFCLGTYLLQQGPLKFFSRHEPDKQERQCLSNDELTAIIYTISQTRWGPQQRGLVWRIN